MRPVQASCCPRFRLPSGSKPGRAPEQDSLTDTLMNRSPGVSSPSHGFVLVLLIAPEW